MTEIKNAETTQKRMTNRDFPDVRVCTHVYIGHKIQKKINKNPSNKTIDQDQKILVADISFANEKPRIRLWNTKIR